MTNHSLCRLICALFVILGPFAGRAEAQAVAGTGRIVGHVVDGEHGTPIAGAQVGIAGTTIATTAALDGRFTLVGVPAGTVEIRARRIGYGPKAIGGVTVPANGAVEQDVTLHAEVLQLDEIRVTVSAERGSVSAAMQEVRNAPTIINTLPAELMRKTPDSDAGQAVQRVAGVTVQDGKYVFVRGLGERYTTTSLNNARIPSPEPERKVVPLDLFPSSLLDQITTSKTFTPDQPGDFSGASVNLKTREFPLGRKFTISLGSGYNDAITGKSIFKAPTVGKEWMGSAGAQRAIPGDLANVTTLTGRSVTEVNSMIASFRPTWSAVPGTGLPTYSAGISLGGEDPIFGQRIGYLGSFTYSYGDDAHKDEHRSTAVANGLTGETRAQNAYFGSTTTTGVLWGGLLNLSTRIASGTKVSLNNTYTRTADNQATLLAGYNEEFATSFDITRLTFTQRAVRSNQLAVEHLIGGKHRLDWSITSSGVNRYEPDRSDLVYLATVDTVAQTSHPIEWWGAPRSASRTFSDLSEHAWDGNLSFRYALGAEAAVKVGGSLRTATRDADSRPYELANLGLTDAQRAGAPESVLSASNATAGQLFMFVNAQGGKYTADDKVSAGFAQFELPLGSRLRFIGGARVEHALLTVDSRSTGGQLDRAVLNNTDVLPSLALTLKVAPTQNFRLSASQTLSRPEYRELSPIEYEDILGGLSVTGNKDLKRALIQNFDARWEWYPSGGEVLSIGLFAKRFHQPIEKILLATTGASELSFVNADGASNFGAELEIRKNLGTLGAALRPFSFFANTTLMRSRIQPGNTGISALTNANRPMIGQAGHVVNTGLGYADAGGRINATILYNMVGRRIVEVGTFPLPDAYEEPRHLLDVSLELPFIARGTIKLNGKNLLDSPYQMTQGVVTRSSYRTGRTVSMGLSWTL